MSAFHQFITKLGLPVSLSRKEKKEALRRIQRSNESCGADSVSAYAHIYEERNLGLISSDIACMDQDVAAIVADLRSYTGEVVSYGCGIGLVELYLASLLPITLKCLDSSPQAIQYANQLKAVTAAHNIHFHVRDYVANTDNQPVHFGLCLRGFPTGFDQYCLAADAITADMAPGSTLIISDNFTNKCGEGFFMTLGYPFRKIGPNTCKGIKPLVPSFRISHSTPTPNRVPVFNTTNYAYPFNPSNAL